MDACWYFPLFLVVVAFLPTDLEGLPFNPKTTGQPWPMPQEYITTDDVFVLSHKFQFQITGKNCSLLAAAIKRYSRLVQFSRSPSYFGKKNGALILSELKVNLMGECPDWPVLNMDEAYDLIIGYTGAVLNSKSVWGIMRGLETFSQIIYKAAGASVVNVTAVHDFPRFSHRGVLLDTSRHFLPKQAILKTLDGMVYNKLNVFHWHIVDDPSFPYQSTAFPQITKKGAYDPVTHIYTQTDVAEIMEYARQRGIRVIPEFDTPGHSQSWGPGQPGLLTPCYDTHGKPTNTFGPIDPSKNSTYSFLDKFMKEVTTVFRDHYLHLGGDEVSFACWKSNPNITQFMEKMSFGTDYAQLESYYIEKLLQIVTSFNTGYIVWQEVFDNHVKVKSDTVIHVWKGGYQAELSRVTKAGYHALLSSPWYLDYIKIGPDWKTYYQVDPQDFNATDAQKQLLLGGEACLWGEYVDVTNVESRLWPRASAVAERLWSSKELTDANRAAPRMEEHRCRMVQRGIHAEPPSGPGFCKIEASLDNI